MRIYLQFLLFFMICLGGCAQVPPQTVELSTTIGKDLEDLHRSHRKAVDLLHDHNVDLVNQYIQEKVVPVYVKAAVDAVGKTLIDDIQHATGNAATDDDRQKAYDSTKDAKGTITVMRGEEKKTVELKPSGSNALEAQGAFKVGAGAKAVATITLSGRKPQEVSWMLK